MNIRINSHHVEVTPAIKTHVKNVLSELKNILIKSSIFRPR